MEDRVYGWPCQGHGNALDGAILRTRSPAPVAILQARPGGSLLHAQCPAQHIAIPQADKGRVIKVMVINLFLCLTLFSTYASRDPTRETNVFQVSVSGDDAFISLSHYFFVYAHLISQVHSR